MISFKDTMWLLFLTMLFFICFYSYFSLPDVYWSYSKNKCVRVICNGVELGCSDLPEKYNRIMVK